MPPAPPVLDRDRAGPAARALFGRGGGKGGGGGGGISEAPNTLRSRTVAKMVHALCEGPILGLADVVENGGSGAKSIYANDTALQNSDGGFNFADVPFEYRLGTPDQTYMAGYPAVKAEISVATKITHAAPVTRTVTNLLANRAIVTLRFPALASTAGNAVVGTSVRFTIERKATGGVWQTVYDLTISEKCTSPADLSYSVALPGTGPWDIRVTRITADSTVTTLQNEIWWYGYTEVIDRKLSYMNTAVVGLAADAEKFGGSIPTWSFDGYWKLVQVPSNYDPVTREYDGIWDGTFQTAWTDNPAWIYHDMIDNDRFGVRRFAPDVAVNKWDLYQIAQYCDELVPDGLGGFEPRFTFNGVINTIADAYAVLQSIAAVFRGMAFYIDGEVTATQDRPDDPEILVSPANVVDGHIPTQGTSLATRPTVLLVTWYDPADNYRPAIEVVERRDLVARFGWRQSHVVAFGCTRRGQAVRHGRWMLDVAWSETETASYVAGMDHAFARPGRIAAVNDPGRAGVRHAGRAAGGTTTSLTLDAPVELEAGDYTLSIITVAADKPVIVERPVLQGAGVHAVLTWTTPLAEAPDVNAMWAVSGGAVALRQYRILRVAEQDKIKLAVQALSHDPQKYARIENNLVLPPISYSTLPTGKLGPPGAIRADVQDTIEAGSLVRSLLISWSAAADPRAAAYEAEARRPGSASWERVVLAPTLAAEIRPAVDGAWGFRVRSRDSLNGFSNWTVNDPVTINQSTDPPAAVTGFSVDAANGTGRAQWDPHPDGDVITSPGRFEIRFSPDTVAPAWDAATPVPGPTIPGRANEANVPLRSGSYLIKAIDIDGNYALEPAIFITTLPDVVGRDVVASKDEAPDWLGLKTSTVVVAGALLLDTADLVSEWPLISTLPSITYAGGVAASGSYVGGILDLGEVYQNVRLVATVAVQVFNPLDTIGGRAAPISTWESITGAVLADVARAIYEIRVTQDDPADPDAVWSDWQPFLVGDFQGRGFQDRLRLTTDDPAYNLRVAQMSLAADVRDRVERLAVTTGTGADTTWTFPGGAFFAVPVIGHSIEEVAPGDFLDLDPPSRSAVVFCVRNAANARIARKVHLTAAGFGRSV